MYQALCRNVQILERERGRKGEMEGGREEKKKGSKEEYDPCPQIMIPVLK